jgi:hypothetical protein
MDVSFIAVIVCAVLAMVVGFVWYGPLFGTIWMRINHVNAHDVEARKKMQKEAGPLYGVQFVLTIVQIVAVARFTLGLDIAVAIANAFWIYFGFIIPMAAGAAMWNNDSRSVMITRFLLTAGYQLLLLVIFATITQWWQ